MRRYLTLVNAGTIAFLLTSQGVLASELDGQFAQSNTAVTVTTGNKQIVSPNLEQYIVDVSPKLDQMLETESNLSSTATCSNDWCRYINSAGNDQFVNITQECRWAIFSVTSSRGYSGIWHHRAEPFQIFGWPPYKDKKATVTKSTLTTLPCSAQPPGTSY